MAIRKDVAYYRSLPYRRIVDVDETAANGPLFIARIQEMPFIRIHGGSREEALARLDEVFDDCVQSLIDAQEAIPEPEVWPGQGVRMEEPQLRFLDQEAPTHPATVTFLTEDNVSPWTIPPPGAITVGV